MRRAAAFALPALLLAGCAAASQAPAQTDALTIENRYPLEYAKQFTVDVCAGGYDLITIDGSRYLVVPEGAAAPANLDADITVLQQPIQNIYLVSSSAMDPIISIGGLGAVALSGTQAENWYLDAARTAMEQGEIAYAGKYSAPDYETILSADCGLAIENTMIYHTPEVKEQLEKFGVPVLVERSSYESDPLARMEWVKLYGILLGRTEEAERIFDDAVQRIAPLLDEEPTGKTAAFFSITSNNLATVRKGGDYVAKMIGLAGGSYVFADLTDSGNNLATVNISLEDFYAGARNADVLFYNSTIEGELRTMDELLAKCPMLADFKAVQSGSVWCTSQSLFQQSMELPDLILDMNKVFTEEGVDAVMMLRLQRERMEEGLVPSLEDYHARYGLTAARLARAAPGAAVLHPGPINRGVEIASSVADGPQSVILSQVTFGIAVRMAVMSIVAGNEA